MEWHHSVRCHSHCQYWVLAGKKYSESFFFSAFRSLLKYCPFFVFLIVLNRIFVWAQHWEECHWFSNKHKNSICKMKQGGWREIESRGTFGCCQKILRHASSYSSHNDGKLFHQPYTELTLQLPSSVRECHGSSYCISHTLRQHTVDLGNKGIQTHVFPNIFVKIFAMHSTSNLLFVQKVQWKQHLVIW